MLSKRRRPSHALYVGIVISRSLMLLHVLMLMLAPHL